MLEGLRIVDTDLFLRTFLNVSASDVSSVASALDDHPTSGQSVTGTKLNVYRQFVENANTILGAYDGDALNVHSYWRTFGSRQRPASAACVLGDLHARFRAKRLIVELEYVEDSDDESQADKLLSLVRAALEFASKLCARRIVVNKLLEDIRDLNARIRGDNGMVHDQLVQTGHILTRLLREESGDSAHVPPVPLTAPMSYWVKHIKVLIELLWLRRMKEEENLTLEDDSPSWIRVNTPVAIRQKNSESGSQYDEGSMRLCREMQAVLRTQLDRHFVFGLLLKRRGLRVFYGDRSGFLRTDSWIDVRTQDDKFIQVVLALSALHPRMLGWDQSMKLYRNPSPGVHEFCYTTDPKIQLEDFGPSPSHTRWAIFVPDDDTSARGAWYLTIQHTNFQWESSVIGPASMNWTVRKLNSDMTDVTEGPPLALTLSWIRSTSPTEQELHGPTPTDHVGVILSSVKSGFVDSDGFSAHDTQSLRRDVQVTEAPRHRWEKAPAPVEPRVLVKTLSHTLGWPVKFFADLTELVRTIRDALQGHHNLYFKNGVLHRNITPDNILICPTDSESSDPDLAVRTSGCLVDLDHAKQSLQRIKYDPRGLDIGDERRKFIQSELSNHTGLDSKLDDIWRRCQGNKIETCILACQFETIEKSCSDFDKVMDALCFPSEEQYRRWLDESQSISRPPSWKDVFSGGPERTGTYLFMSYEVLFGEAYPRGMSDDYPHRNRPDIGKTGTPIHSAIHDLESFFWVLVYQCFVRNGPGGRRRREVMPGRSMTTRLNALFNNKNPVQKLKLFKYPDLFERDVVPDFHPYFNRLKPLVLEWWHLLICTYRTYDDVTQGLIHDKILGLLDKHLDGIVSGEPDEAEMSPKAIRREQAELRRREDECNQLAISTLWDGPSEVNAEGQDQDVDLDSSGDESSPGGDINEYLED
ncbi:hypothetical protein EUX98_g9585 [Antrodiella citrinella]|uniref:Fungal-type protein kinase domain-containing protein n=1 Tax=Antrodiella citrinella TaxID=2447956 RepID=A0A4V3XER6_9APHY|nr:hypothetical protein EUX98_g9585 [Antrodiella citrinella]